MPAFFSSQLGGGLANARTFPTPGVGLGGKTVHWARGVFTPLTALTTGDTLDLFDLPPRARVVDGFVKSADLDTNGAPTYAFNVGIAGTPSLFFAAANAPQAGTVNRMTLAAAHDFVTTARTRVVLVPSANAATFSAAGDIVVMLAYIVEEPA